MNSVLRRFADPICLDAAPSLSGLSAWVEHIPFAMNLVASIRPETIVELGTHAGDSYLALCHAVERCGIPARCYAVDTWKGDPQAGTYGPEVLAGLRAFHDARYGTFSRLVQSTFDEARAHFADGSIDLLHIDGLHTADAVRHDYETWRPKLSRQGVVLFHDTNVREHDFGVSVVWEELKERHPHFEFFHGHGLGVLAPAEEVPPALLPLLEVTGDDAAGVRAFFFELGRRISVGLERDALARQRDTLANELRNLDAARTIALAEQREREREYAALRADTDRLKRERDAQQSELEGLRRHAAEQDETIARMTGTAVWRAGQRYWALRDRVLSAGSHQRRVFDAVAVRMKRTFGRDGFVGIAAAIPGAARILDPYAAWVAANTATEAELAAQRDASEALPVQPLVSVLTPVYDIDECWLRRCIESVRAQSYSRWELCLVDDASPRPHVQSVLAEYAALDPRIRWVRSPRNEGIVGASARALEMAKGDFVALLDHDDELSPDALYEVVKHIGEHEDVDLVYSDEDKLDESGRRFCPFFKPDWSPELLTSMNYICHLGVYRRSLLVEVGGFRPGYDGSQDYDLVLRFTERARRVIHLPKVLYHWRVVATSAAGSTQAKPYAYVAGQRALESALERRGVTGRVSMVQPGLYRTSYAIVGEPLVSIVMPTKDKVELLRKCVDSIREKSTYRNFELLVVDNGSVQPETTAYLRELERAGHAKVLPYPHRFNWSALNNFGASHSRGEYLLFMNNDMEVVEPGWIEALLGHAQRPGIGVVGAKLLFPDDTIQHAGVLVGVCGTANHAFRRVPAMHLGYFGFAQVVRNCAAVTGACMMVSRRVFEQLGGFDEKLRVAFNDVDFCLRALAAGQRVVYAPDATLYHYESATRRAEHPAEDEQLMRERWATVIASDPFHNPNLSRDHDDFRVA